MKKALLMAFLLSSPQAQAEMPSEFAFLGSLQKLVLIPRDRPGCPEPVAPEGVVVISNHCGCGTATFSVVDSFGLPDGEEYGFDFRVGEWCEPDLNLFQDAEFLVFKAEGMPHRWIEAVTTENGIAGFYAEQLDLLFHEFGIAATDLDFGPEEIEVCEEAEGIDCCETQPIVLPEELLEALHITNRSSTFRP